VAGDAQVRIPTAINGADVAGVAAEKAMPTELPKITDAGYGLIGRRRAQRQAG
jgi:hypothetical protein